MMRSFVFTLSLLLLLTLFGCAAAQTPASVQTLSPKPLTTPTTSCEPTDPDPSVSPEPEPLPDTPETDARAESLKQFRDEREGMIQWHGDLVEGGAPNEALYGLDTEATRSVPPFDSREVTEAGRAAEQYLTNTLNFEPETKLPYYMCVDPDILNLYLDEDKGVCAGYPNEDIYVWEFCKDGQWQYLFLVRDGKGSPWSVIHHGSHYKEQEN